MLCILLSYFRGLKAEPNILRHALSKVEVVQEKNIMSSDSLKIESSVNSVRMFWREHVQEKRCLSLS